MDTIIQVLRKVVILIFYGELLIRILGSKEYQRYLRYGLGIMVIAITLGPILSLWNDGIDLEKTVSDKSISQKIDEMSLRMKGVEKGWQIK